MKLDTYHRYATLFDAFSFIVGTGDHVSDLTLFESGAEQALKEWAGSRSLVAEEGAPDPQGWSMTEVRIGRHAGIRVHIAPATTDPVEQPIEPEIAF